LICGTPTHGHHGPIAMSESYSPHLLYMLFLGPLIAFIIQIILAILSIILVLSEKLSIPGEPEKQDEGENIWGLSQTLSVTMLLLPEMDVCHAYRERRQHIQEANKPSRWDNESYIALAMSDTRIVLTARCVLGHAVCASVCPTCVTDTGFLLDRAYKSWHIRQPPVPNFLLI
jgi:hypothetical protein